MTFLPVTFRTVSSHTIPGFGWIYPLHSPLRSTTFTVSYRLFPLILDLLVGPGLRYRTTARLPGPGWNVVVASHSVGRSPVTLRLIQLYRMDCWLHLHCDW